MSIIISDAFKVIEGHPVTSSRIVAEYFGKQHHHVVRDIRSLIKQKPELLASRNFAQWSEEVEIGSGATRTVTGYLMDRKGFSILAMGFTGAKALDFKCAFYDEFERLENELNNNHKEPVIEYINDEQRWAIQSEVAKRVHSTQATYQTIYRALKAHFRVPKYTHILANQFDEAVNFIRSFNANVPEHTHHTNDDERCPCCGLRPLPSGSLVLLKRHAEAIANFTYSMRYLFRSDLELIYSFLRNSQSPKAPHFCELVNNLELALLEDVLRQYGYDVTKMPCYLAFTSNK